MFFISMRQFSSVWNSQLYEIIIFRTNGYLFFKMKKRVGIDGFGMFFNSFSCRGKQNRSGTRKEKKNYYTKKKGYLVNLNIARN